jgi:hypothetical protein
MSEVVLSAVYSQVQSYPKRRSTSERHVRNDWHGSAVQTRRPYLDIQKVACIVQPSPPLRHRNRARLVRDVTACSRGLHASTRSRTCVRFMADNSGVNCAELCCAGACKCLVFVIERRFLQLLLWCTGLILRDASTGIACFGAVQNWCLFSACFTIISADVVAGLLVFC